MGQTGGQGRACLLAVVVIATFAGSGSLVFISTSVSCSSTEQPVARPGGRGCSTGVDDTLAPTAGENPSGLVEKRREEEKK